MAVLFGKTPRELDAALTQSELAHLTAFWNMYPMGEEAMDIRLAAILSALAGGIPVVQVKRGKSVKWSKHMPFSREFWTRPLSPKSLVKKTMAVFSMFGMKTEEKDKNG